MLRIVLLSFLCFWVSTGFSQSFENFVSQIKQEAIKKGYSQAVADKAFKDVRLLKRVTHKNRHQYQAIVTFETYKNHLVSSYRIQAGRKKLKDNAELLETISQHYQVPASMIVSLWGLESAYGVISGHMPEFSALTTLAYDSHRKQFFKAEIFAALKMLQDKKTPLAKMQGSWAGAMGQCQFMPTSYLNDAVAWQHKGAPDIWDNKGDIFASIANFLKHKGWVEGEPLILKVSIPKDLSDNKIGMHFSQTLSQWAKQGITLPKDLNLKNNTLRYALILPENKAGPAYLVIWRNFRAIMHWNASTFYALSASILSQKIQ